MKESTEALILVHSRRWKTRAEPAFDVVHDRLLPDVVEQIVKVAVVELQGLVRGAGGIKEGLAATRFGGIVARAVQRSRSGLVQSADGRQHRRRAVPLFDSPVDGRHHRPGCRRPRRASIEPDAAVLRQLQ